MNNNFKIFIYLFILQNFKSFLTNTILIFKRKWFLKKIFEHKNQRFDIDDIKRKIDELTKLIKIKNNVNISKLGKDLILITSKSVENETYK